MTPIVEAEVNKMALFQEQQCQIGKEQISRLLCVALISLSLASANLLAPKYSVCPRLILEDN